MIYRRLLAALTRVTSSGTYIPEIDGLRFVAIASVVLFHVRSYLGAKSGVSWQVPLERDFLARMLFHLDRGVPLFFGISGFVLSLPFAIYSRGTSRRPSLRAYYRRRLTRLEPPYLLSLLVFSLMLWLVNHRSAGELAPHTLASAAYVHNVLYRDPSAINVVYWSLEIEVQFYLLAPFICRIFEIRPRRPRRLILALMLIATSAASSSLGQYRLVTLSLVGALPFFLVGLLFADIYVDDWRCAPPHHPIWDCVAVPAFLALFATTFETSLEKILFPPLMLVVYGAVFRGVYVRRALTTPLLTTIGGMCYSIYLLHYKVISAVGLVTIRATAGHTFWLNFLVQASLLGTAVIIASAGYFLLVERPCMSRDWPERLAAWAASSLRRRNEPLNAPLGDTEPLP